MSFPSIARIAAKRGIDTAQLEDESVARSILAEAIELDCPLAVDYLHNLVHRADEAGEEIIFDEDPNSPLGKQIVRLFAAEVVRNVVRENFLHDREICFYNCCGGSVPPKDKPPVKTALRQVKMQAGPIAREHC